MVDRRAVPSLSINATDSSIILGFSFKMITIRMTISITIMIIIRIAITIVLTIATAIAIATIRISKRTRITVIKGNDVDNINDKYETIA